MPETQDKPLHELLSRTMVDIYVGSENTHWILHEKLLCYHSPFFRKIFYNKTANNKSFGLPDEEDLPFKVFVGWLYSSSLPIPREEKDLGVQFELYLMGEKWQIPALVQDVLQTVREWYKYSESYPGLRRVQYIYANTEDGSPMRHMLVHSIARLMVLEKGIPQHWDKALKKNGQLAVDIIRAIQEWQLDDEVVPDAREEPADAEELIEDEVEAAQEEAEAEVENDDETMVESGVSSETKSPQRTKSDANVNKNTNAGAGDQKQKLVNGTGKALNELPNGLTNGDYGTIH